ncbi:MAG: protein-tyrosine-phosphatase, partial [Luteibaculum sp.]
DRLKVLEQSIPDDRKKVIANLAKKLKDTLESKESLGLIFVCTHNSRRSFFAEAWAQLAIEHYSLSGKLKAYSAGTEATEIHPNTLKALERAGFAIEKEKGSNPKISLKIAQDQYLLSSFSKTLEDSSLPKKDFFAIMVCSSADDNCPFVPGALHRQPLTFEDPKISDGSSLERQTYDNRSQEIGAQMFYLIDRIANN